MRQCPTILLTSYGTTVPSPVLYFQTVRDYIKTMKYPGRFFEYTSIAFDTTWLLALALHNWTDNAVKMQSIDPEGNDRNKYLDLTDELKMRMISQDFEGISVRMIYFSCFDLFISSQAVCFTSTGE